MKHEIIEVPGYEKVFKIEDPSVGLTALIALHDLTLGPALGGTRIRPYANIDEALQDVLRLSQGMTYKAAISQVGFGGGKSVIMADPKTQKTPELLHAFGKAVEELLGKYICAEDVGCTTADVTQIRKMTRYVVGLPHSKSSGDPGPFTARGIYRAMQATAQKLYGSDSLAGLTIAIQGLGNVGQNLARYLFWAGANMIVSDIDPERVQTLVDAYRVRVASPDEILFAECDFLAPCALGGILNDQTIPRLRCRAVVGGANNQLLKDSHADDLRHRGILLAPDFVANGGGLINVAAELEPNGYSPTASRDKINCIYDSLLAIYKIAEENGESTYKAAVSLANHRLKNGIGKRISPPIFHHS